jgi:energy-coupling factor transporter ATP-binding protein EcfA2
MTKIKKLSITGLRGIRSDLILDLENKSVLLYGDNGSGKSSITDAIEWFYFDRIKHLSNEEIGKGGIEGLRCSVIDESEESVADFKFSNSNLDSKKTLALKKSLLVSSYSNNTEEFKNYLDFSMMENIYLRYQDLMSFILETKMNKLKAFSTIIGFSDVVEMRAILKKSVNDLNKEIRNRNFEGQISAKQSYILGKLQQNITSDKQFIQVINEQLKNLRIEHQLTNINEIKDIEKILANPEANKIIEIQSFYQRASETLTNFLVVLEEIESSYQIYFEKYTKISSDLNKLYKISLENLLNEGVKLLENPGGEDDLCPLCLQPIKREELFHDLTVRLIELVEVKKEKEEMETIGESLSTIIEDANQQFLQLITNKIIEEKDNSDLKKQIKLIITNFETYLIQLKLEVTSGKKLISPQEILLDKQSIEKITETCKSKEKSIQKEIESDKRLTISTNILSASEAYAEYKNLTMEKKKMEIQSRTLEIIYLSFVKKQRESLETFLSSISQDVNEIYQFMHPEEKVDNIQLSLVEKDDELIGITIKYKFFGRDTTPPQKYLSESHLNCLGIALFLASVKMFNHQNRFFILDDVISSFDTGHRKRFADLLIEKFQDYQIIIMTHEKHWFDIMLNLVRGKSWLVNQIKYSEEKGTYIDIPPLTLKERIEDKIKKNNDEELGNEIRKYLENILKIISENLEVKMKYLPNERNEERMAVEMLTELKSKLDRHKCLKIKDNPLTDRVISSIFIANRDSHDNPINPSIDDFKVFWKDLQDFEKLFICSSCNRYISVKKYDAVQKKIQCNCGKLNYEWKD